MMKPLSTSLISSDRFKDVDVDLAARRVYGEISDPDARTAIETRLTEFYGEPVTLDTVYDSQSPLRAFPAPPRIELSAEATPLPENPSIGDLRRWTLAWNVIADLADTDTIGTELIVADAAIELPRAEANAFERALLEFDGANESAQRIGNSAIEPHPPVDVVALNGPASGSETFDILDQPRMGVRATLIRNGAFPPDCRYIVSVTSAPVSATIDRTDREYDLEQLFSMPDASLPELLAPLQSLNPERVAIYFTPSERPMLVPVLLVVDSWDADEVARVLVQWREESQQNAEGRYVLDVSTRGLRLRLAVMARN
jgi:hypothetical protein